MLGKSFLLFCAFSFLFACNNASNGGEGVAEVDMSFLDKVNATHKDMVTVISNSTTVVGKDLPYKPNSPITHYLDGAFVKGRTVELKPFQIGKYEVTYELWTEVMSWALKNNYSFLFQGSGGSESSGNSNGQFIPPTEENKWQPVVWVTWRSAVVWCNAYSEMVGLRPVYYTDIERKVPIRTTTPCNPNDPEAPKYNQVPNDTPGYVDAPYVDWQANGFRLPTETEWEMAARGGNPNVTEWGYRYPTCDKESDLNDYAWTESNSEGKTHTVGMKKPNKLGLYDMSGNAYEHCFDWFTGETNEGYSLIGIPWYGPETRPKDEVTQPIQSSRVNRGCSFLEPTDSFRHTLGFRLSWNPTRATNAFGFRLARSLVK